MIKAIFDYILNKKGDNTVHLLSQISYLKSEIAVHEITTMQLKESLEKEKAYSSAVYNGNNTLSTLLINATQGEWINREKSPPSLSSIDEESKILVLCKKCQRAHTLLSPRGCKDYIESKTCSICDLYASNTEDVSFDYWMPFPRFSKEKKEE
ncbi:hypothetical protein HC928_02450 [bacterium]|nr:hypothetical protein [bacterium]